MNHSPKFTKLSVLTYSAILLGLATAAQALPTNEVETTYYSDATRTDEVGGLFRGCDGSLSAWGKRTRYATRTSTPCSSGGGPEPQPMPCEFTQAGCPNYPSRDDGHYVDPRAP